MNGVLVLAHGSRIAKTKETINTVVDMVRLQMKDTPIVIAYMEFCEENIERGIKELVDMGVTHIKAVPYFLFEGIHIKEDIPNELNAILKDYPGVTLEMGDTLGADERLAAILIDRIAG